MLPKSQPVKCDERKMTAPFLPEDLWLKESGGTKATESDKVVPFRLGTCQHGMHMVDPYSFKVDLDS